MIIWCCECLANVEARLTSGAEVYPTRRDLDDLPFWKCDGCGNHVGCHHRHHDRSLRTRPLGTIAGPEMKKARQHIHRRLDPLWKEGHIRRKVLYGRLSGILGRGYHTADLRTLYEAGNIFRAITRIQAELSLSDATSESAAASEERRL